MLLTLVCGAADLCSVGFSDHGLSALNLRSFLRDSTLREAAITSENDKIHKLECMANWYLSLSLCRTLAWKQRRSTGGNAQHNWYSTNQMICWLEPICCGMIKLHNHFHCTNITSYMSCVATTTDDNLLSHNRTSSRRQLG